MPESGKLPDELIVRRRAVHIGRACGHISRDSKVNKKCRGWWQNVGKVNTISALKTRIYLNVVIKTGECFSDACLPAPAHSDEAAASASQNQLLLNIAAHRFSELIKVNLYLRRPKSYF